MRIEILFIIFLVSFGIAFLNYKKKMKDRITDNKENSKE